MIRFADQILDWRPGMTIADVVGRLKDGHHVAVVRLNGKLVSRPEFASTPVPDKAKVEPLPMIAGG